MAASMTSAFRWLDASLSLPTSFMRWPRLFASYFTPNWGLHNFNFSSLSPRGGWSPRSWVPDFSIVDTVLWSFVTAFDSRIFYFVGKRDRQVAGDGDLGSVVEKKMT
ncbi:hypothetical protein ACH5RR_001660 [Cinchona calisaya]|uniref:Uncharacterized protein n=1 Tax=Cinchona calisaya TaxID=153742 RepID=A0ABD3B5A8_9GENT